MPSYRPGLPMFRHRALGKRLHELQAELTHLSVEIANAEGLTSPVAKMATRAAEALFELRAELENAMFRRYPSERSTAVYFPLGDRAGSTGDE